MRTAVTKSIASLIWLSACSDSVIEVDSIDSVCHPDISVEGCARLNGKTLSIRGYLMENEYLNRPHLVQKREDIESYSEDTETYPLGVEIMVSQLDRATYQTFLGKEVIMTGHLDTNCPPIIAKKNAQMEADIKSGKEFITTGFISGDCHYFSNVFMAVNTASIRKVNP